MRVLLSTGLVLLSATAEPGPAVAEEAECDATNTSLVAEPPAAFKQLGIPAAQRLSIGGELTVAVVDSGVSAQNPHLKAALRPGKDFVGNTNGQVDKFGLGTAVAGQIAARQISGSGLIGVAPAAKILPVRVYEALDTESTQPKPATTANGIKWAANQAGVRVIVVPTSFNSDNQQLRSAVGQAEARGVLVVASAGDSSEEGKNVGFPAAVPGALSVTALDANGVAASSANHGTHVEVAAPGASVLTAVGKGDCVLAGSSPSSSFAAGYAAGVAALVAATHRDESPAEWQYRIMATALRPAGAGQSQETGWGTIAPYSAINFVDDGQQMGPPNPNFKTPKKSVAPALPPPSPGLDPAAATPLIAAGVLGLGAMLVLAGLLLRRLRRRA